MMNGDLRKPTNAKNEHNKKQHLILETKKREYVSARSSAANGELLVQYEVGGGVRPEVLNQWMILEFQEGVRVERGGEGKGEIVTDGVKSVEC